MKKSFSSIISLRSEILVSLGILMLPGVTFAVAQPIISLVSLLESIITALFPIIIAFGILVFGYNIFNYLRSKDLANQNLYKGGIINSLGALFILFVFYGVIKVVARSLGIPELGVDLGTANNTDAFASASGGIATLRNIALQIAKFTSERVIPIMIAIGILFFMGNTVIAMTKGDQEKEREELNKYLRWGLLALFVLFTAISLVGFLTGSFFGTRPLIPQFETSE
jgi:magnesium-transporting ATPase (P-type)